MAMALKLDDVFHGRTVPSWLRRFETEPVAALHDLFLGSAQLGLLGPAEPSTLLLGWLEGLGDRFAGHVDEALAEWIERHWGLAVLPASRDSTRISVVAWRRAFDVLGRDTRLVEAYRVLRAHMPEDRAFLAAMREGRSHDAESRAWLALSLRQEDREMARHWWWLCGLPPDVPWTYGSFGVHGLRHLPEERPGTGGGFPHEVAEGLVRLGDALVRRVEEGWLHENKARDDFLRTARLAVWGSNFPEKWLTFWRQTLPADEEDRLIDGWVRKLFPEKLKKYRSPRRARRRRHLDSDPLWLTTSREIRQRLPEEAAVSDAWSLVREQQHFADVTGENHFAVRTACNFAGRVRRTRPELALEWTALARRYDPWNAFAWTTEASVLLVLGRLADARRTAFEAVRRFPYDPVAYAGLGEVLRAQHRLDDAEAVYREAVRRFPDDDVAPSGLGEVLKLQGRLADAEAVYREAVHRFQDDEIAPNGLGGVLRALRRWDEAEKMYRIALARKPGDRFALAGLRQLERERHSFELAEDTVPYGEGQDTGKVWQPVDVEVVLQDTFLLRHWARDMDPARRRERARHLLGRLTEAADSDAAAASECGLLALSLDDEDLEETRGLLQLAAKRFPGSARVRYALARAERALAEREGDASAARLKQLKKLARLDSRLQPVQLLGEARTLAATSTNGSDALRDCFGELGWWIERTFYYDAEKAERRRENDAVPFNVAWARDLKKNLFAGRTIARAEDVDDLDLLRANLAANGNDLDFQEEVYVSHLSVA